MNQIQEKDWAEESWHSHTGIDSSCDYCIVDGKTGEIPVEPPEAASGQRGAGRAAGQPKNDCP